MIIPNIWKNKIHVPNHQPDLKKRDSQPIGILVIIKVINHKNIQKLHGVPKFTTTSCSSSFPSSYWCVLRRELSGMIHSN